MTANVSKSTAGSMMPDIQASAATRRYLALYCPLLPTDRWKRARASRAVAPDDRPLVLVDKIKGAMRIGAADEAALALGIGPGLALADAHARVPGIAVAACDAAADDRLLHALAEACERFSPLLAIDAPYGLILDITGAAHLFGGEEGLRTRAVALLAAHGLTARATIAATPASARALCRFARLSVCPPGDDARLVGRLPPTAISGIEPETARALARAGLTTIAEVARRPCDALAARFGAHFVTALNRTLAREACPLIPLRPAPEISAVRVFADPCTATAAIEETLKGLLIEAADALAEKSLGGRRFEAHFYRSDGTRRLLLAETGRPSRDPEAVLRLLRERLAVVEDPLDPGFGFDLIRIDVSVTEPLAITQPGFEGDARAGDDDVEDLIDRLTARLGRARVLRFTPTQSHDPHRETHLVPATARALTPRKSPRGDAWSPPEPGEPPLRPLSLFSRPQPIEAMAQVPDGPPVRFRWRRVVHHVVRAEGPERISAEWWRATGTDGLAPASRCRDYYRLEDEEGARFWVFRDGLYGASGPPPRWFLHGLFA